VLEEDALLALGPRDVVRESIDLDLSAVRDG